ncbi:hypothetical protein Tco_0798720 [Tanacetum coccineum]
MMRINGVLHGHQKKKLHCAKLEFVYSKIVLMIVRTKAAQFCGVYDNTTQMSISGAGDGDYTQLAITEYQVKYGVPFTLVGDDEDEEEDVQEVQRPMGRDISKKKGEASMKSSTSSNEDASARLMVNEYGDITPIYKERKSKNVEEFIEIRKRELTDNLYGQEVEMTLDLKRVIKERWDLTY